MIFAVVAFRHIQKNKHTRVRDCVRVNEPLYRLLKIMFEITMIVNNVVVFFDIHLSFRLSSFHSLSTAAFYDIFYRSSQQSHNYVAAPFDNHLLGNNKTTVISIMPQRRYFAEWKGNSP